MHKKWNRKLCGIWRMIHCINVVGSELTHKIYINIFIITLFYYIYKHKIQKQKPKKSR